MLPQWNPYTDIMQITTDTDAHADNDVMGGLLSVRLPVVQGGAFLHDAILVDAGGDESELDLYIYEHAPDTIADNAAFAPTAQDESYCRGRLTFSTYRTETAASVSHVALSPDSTREISLDCRSRTLSDGSQLGYDKAYLYLVNRSGGNVTKGVATELVLITHWYVA